MNYLKNLDMAGGNLPLRGQGSSPSPKSSPPGRGLAWFHADGVEETSEVSSVDTFAARGSMIDRNARPTGFTLIELLVVISIIGILAGLTIGALKVATKHKKISTATAEMKELEGAIENYRNKYGVYPPGNGSNTFSAALYSPLYYELTGVSFADPAHTIYTSISSNVPVSSVTSVFNVSGILNCSKGGGEEMVNSENFLPGLRGNRVQPVWEGTAAAQMLTTSVGGPDDAYLPLDNTPGVNVFRYKQADPTNNNPGSYDLWVNLSIGATNGNGSFNKNNLLLIANWNKNYQGNSQMP